MKDCSFHTIIFLLTFSKEQAVIRIKHSKKTIEIFFLVMMLPTHTLI